MPKKQKGELGKALQKRSNPAVHVQRPSDVYVQEWAGPGKGDLGLQSALDMTDLNSMAEMADLAQTRFVAEKQKTVLLQTTSVIVPEHLDEVTLSEQRKNWNNLTIPRRPAWTAGMPVEELDLAERKSFLQWRRRLGELEENEHLLLTPFERNLEVWKQLWRVIERSDIVVQILDSRDPLLFRSLDLEKYVLEFQKKKVNVLLMNKSDLLSEPQRKTWAEYFKKEGIRVIFFSARSEQIKIEEEHAAQNAIESSLLHQFDPFGSHYDIEEENEEQEYDDEDDVGAGDEESGEDAFSGEDYGEDQEEATEKKQRQQEKSLYDEAKFNKLLGKDADWKSLMIKSGSSNPSSSSATTSSSNEVQRLEEEDILRLAESKQGSIKALKARQIEEDDEFLKQAQIESAANINLLTSSKTSEALPTITITPTAAPGTTQEQKEDEPFCKMDTSLESITNRIFNRKELFDYLLSLSLVEFSGEREKITVGMVGYPNVGKSSTINVLIEKKKVAVSSTPGKTKHFQTLQVHDNITLCDCPGLVFPTFMSTKAEMFCNGLLRIAEMKECIGPTSIVSRLIPRKEFEYVYGISLPKVIDPKSIVSDVETGKAYAPKAKLHPQQLLETYAHLRGFYIGGNKPDMFKTAKLILNDFVDGKLLFCRAPPSEDQNEYSLNTKYNNPELRIVNEAAPVKPVTRNPRSRNSKQNASTSSSEAASKSMDASDAASTSTVSHNVADGMEEINPEEMINLNDPEELQRLTGAPITNKAKLKHQKVNRKQELRRMKKGHANQERSQDGIHIDFIPGIGKSVRTLPTGVKLGPGKRPVDHDPNSTASGRKFVASVNRK